MIEGKLVERMCWQSHWQGLLEEEGVYEWRS